MNIKFAVVGLIQGIALAALHNYFFYLSDGSLPKWWLPAAVISIYLPVAFYLSSLVAGLSNFKRSIFLIITSLLVVAASYFQALITSRSLGNFEFYLAIHIWGFIVINFAAGILATDKGAIFSHSRYQLMFELAWRNGVLLCLVVAVLSLFLGILQTIAYLFNAIGISFFKFLFEQEFFIYPAMAIVASFLFDFGIKQSRTSNAIRNLLLTATAWLLPLLMVFSCLWLLALIINYQAQFLHGARAWWLLWICALAIKFLNSTYQDGNQKKALPVWMLNTICYLWLAMPVIAALAIYALWLRIVEYGLTDSRIWGALVAVMAMIYTTGYALSVVKRHRGWMHSVAATNIGATAVLLCLIMLLLSPVFYPKKLEVKSQIKRLTNQQIDVKQFNFDKYSSRNNGYSYFSQDLFKTLLADIDHPQAEQIHSYINKTQAAKPIENASQEQLPTVAKLKQSANIKHISAPSGANLDQLYAAIIDKKPVWAAYCLQKNHKCYLVWVDIAPNPGKEAVLIISQNYQRCLPVFGKKQQISYLQTICSEQGIYMDQSPDLLKSLENDSIKINTKAKEWKILELGEHQFRNN